jgi:hypothetical protein
MNEYDTALQVTHYLQWKYPHVRFHHDFGSGVKLTVGQAKKQKALNPYKGYPDIFILAPAKNYSGLFIKHYSGLFIEIKKEGEKIFKKDGKTYKSEHLESQAEYIDYLNENGFYATFGIGFDEIRKIIDDYFGDSTDLDNSYTQF